MALVVVSLHTLQNPDVSSAVSLLTMSHSFVLLTGGTSIDVTNELSLDSDFVLHVQHMTSCLWQTNRELNHSELLPIKSLTTASVVVWEP